MEEINHKVEKDDKKEGRGVHFILSHSYLVFLFSVILGAIFDIFVLSNFFRHIPYQEIGFILIIFGSIVVYWAQRTSGNYKEHIAKQKGESFFYRGPYKFSRHPTHFGLFIMTLGLAFLINSLFSVIFTILAYLLTKKFFIKKQEKILEKKYGEVYKDYKKKVQNWI
jgi:protein-S-isoprenylcysteine O-methyltransferase Ste14